MSKFISSLLALTLSLWFFVWTIQAAATEWVVTQFEVIIPPTARMNEAIDVTIRAVDSDKKVVTWYRWSIIFVPESFWDTVPMPWKSIAFTAEDNGEKKFSKWVIFKSTGKQKVSVVDVTDDISWEASINVESTSSNTGTLLESINVISPSKDSKIASEVVVVSGTARKNSKLNISLNWKNVGSVISDESWVFTKSLSWITQATNLLSIDLVDGAGKIIGKSEDISFEKISSWPGFYNLTVLPWLQVQASSKLTITVDADPWMSEVIIVMDSASLKAMEGDSGKYTVETVAPANVWEYPISVSITNNLGQKVDKSDYLSLSVSAKPSTFENVKATTEWEKVVFNFSLTNPPSDLEKFKISYTDKETGMKGESITWSANKIIKEDWKYEWYINNLGEWKTYSFVISSLRADDSIIDWLQSENVSATIWTSAPTKCTIWNVGDISVETRTDKSILSWKSVTGALSYNLYTITEDGKNVLFQNTKETQYTIFLSSWAVVHKNFWIRALCDDSTESPDLSKVSKVQTGPAMTAIIVIISWILAAIIMRRRTL